MALANLTILERRNGADDFDLCFEFEMGSPESRRKPCPKLFDIDFERGRWLGIGWIRFDYAIACLACPS